MRGEHHAIRLTACLTLGLLAALTVVSACATGGKHRGDAALTRSKPSSRRGTHERRANSRSAPAQKLVKSNDGVLLAPAPVSQTPAIPTATERQAEKSCRDLVQHVGGAFRSLYALLPTGSYVPSGGELDLAVQMQPARCTTPAGRAYTIKTLAHAVVGQSGKIGVVLPLTGPRSRAMSSLVNGMRIAYQEAGLAFDQVAVLKDTGGTARGAEAALAELVFKDRVAFVIGGFEPPAAETLAEWGTKLMLPVVLLTRERELAATSKYVFTLYPDQKHLADTLAAKAAQRGYKRFAVLRPAGGKSDRVAAYFRADVQQQGGQIVNDLIYTPGNFDSMQAVSRQLFKTDPAERADDYRQAMRRARRRAARKHVAFNPRMVVLKPIVDFDCIFIPDDFRTVRHFAKLFKYNQVDHLPLIGDHEWRSPALIDPFDSFLDGSVFADFIGSYTTLPPAVSAPTTISPYFVAADKVAAVDFQLIGYRAARAARLALAQPTLPRPHFADALRSLTSHSPAFFGTGPVFDAGRHSRWPTYLFTVSKQGLTLESDVAHAPTAGQKGQPPLAH